MQTDWNINLIIINETTALSKTGWEVTTGTDFAVLTEHWTPVYHW